MSTENHQLYMRRALDLAMLGRNKVKSNPNVGCVIVHQNRIIGEGYHQFYGGPHAEVNAVDSIDTKDKPLLKYSTMYVTLEPCCIYGKTPPCTNLILNNGIKNVVVSVLDPNPKVAGNGMKILRQNGVNVTIGILEQEGKSLIQPFLKSLNDMPFVTLKWAKTFNNIMGSPNQRIRISGQSANVFTHQLRDQMDGILIGKNTALLDNPKLTTRLINGKNPTRIVIDAKCELPNHLEIFNDGYKTVVCNDQQYRYNFDFKNVTFLNLSNDFKLSDVLSRLYQLGIYRLLVEGGRKTLDQFIEHNLWDEAYTITNKNVLTSTQNDLIKAPNLIGKKVFTIKADKDIILKCIPN